MPGRCFSPFRIIGAWPLDLAPSRPLAPSRACQRHPGPKQPRLCCAPPGKRLPRMVGLLSRWQAYASCGGWELHARPVGSGSADRWPRLGPLGATWVQKPPDQHPCHRVPGFGHCTAASRADRPCQWVEGVPNLVRFKSRLPGESIERPTGLDIEGTAWSGAAHCDNSSRKAGKPTLQGRSHGGVGCAQPVPEHYLA